MCQLDPWNDRDMYTLIDISSRHKWREVQDDTIKFCLAQVKHANFKE